MKLSHPTLYETVLIRFYCSQVLISVPFKNNLAIRTLKQPRYALTYWKGEGMEW